MRITIMSHPKVTSTFKWYGTSGFNSNGLHFYSAKKGRYRGSTCASGNRI